MKKECFFEYFEIEFIYLQSFAKILSNLVIGATAYLL